MIRKEITFPVDDIVKRRTATQMVQLSSRFNSRIMLEQGNKIVNGKSMLGLLSLADGAGDLALILTVDGPDEQEAMEALLALLGE